MGNTITYLDDVEIWLSMSNGGTALLADLLALAGGRLANSSREIYLSSWLAGALDQEMTGWGTVGFDLLKDFPWKISSFKADKTFLLSLIAGAKEKIGWEKLNYIPSVENAEYYLTGFEKVLNALDASFIDPQQKDYWVNSIIPVDPQRCPKHDCFMHQKGCVICHNEG